MSGRNDPSDSQFGNPPSRIDLLSEVDGVSFDEVWRGSLLTTLNDLPLRVIGRRELERNKAATGRLKDAEDLRRLGSGRGRKKR